MGKKLTTDEFIEKAINVHGIYKYDYNSVIYTGTKNKVKIMCKIHNEYFEQSANDHLSGNGCPKCGGNSKLTTSNFIIRSNIIHDNKYDYSLVDYMSSKDKVKIICSEHGMFEQIPNSHLNGRGCPKCSGYNKNTSDFILEAIKIHNDKYDYSKVVYNGCDEKVLIYCNIHKEYFKQSAYSHLMGSGCPKCGIDSRKTKNTRSMDDFIINANKVHNNKYDYSHVIYEKSSENILIICPLHGEFSQIANSHLQGQGCPKCAKIRMADKNKLTTDEFIERSRLKHNDKYDYSKTVYSSIHRLVKIICPIHGEFQQKAGIHIGGSGCQKCANEKRGILSSKANLHTTDDFIFQSKLVHGETYDYSLVEYLGSVDKVKIICSVHGIFEQIPSNHLNGSGCQKCARELTTSNQTRNLNDFINIASSLHMNRYKYDKAEYVNAHVKIKIYCNECNTYFYQAPYSHLSGSGCPKCKMSKGEKLIQSILNNFIINYKTEYTFINLIGVGGRVLRFDFAIFSDVNKHRLICLIEFDGEQHTRWIKGMLTKSQFKTLQHHDHLKNEYCKKNNIPLLRINFDQIDNIEQIVTEELSKYNLINPCLTNNIAI